ncbi:MAG: hypothetical protein NVSMB3_10490 [Acidobacteriaceae bacterium]
MLTLPVAAVVLLVVAPLASGAQRKAKPAASSVASAPEAPPDWKAAADARRKQLIDQNGPGTDPALRDLLLQMRQTDQAARGFMVSAAPAGNPRDQVQQLNATDAELTAQLKSLVAAHGWPTIALVGIDASNAAMLLLTHTADHVWQLQPLPQLEQLADAGKIDASQLALVIDKQLVAAGRLQRYGTQFKFVNGHMAMYAVEDPAGLDPLRARAMLPPMAFYKQMLAKMYGLKVTDEIVSPTPPSAPPPNP